VIRLAAGKVLAERCFVLCGKKAATEAISYQPLSFKGSFVSLTLRADS
jgi:hypothetical protein